MRYLVSLALLLFLSLATSAFAADAIIYVGTPSQTLYVRVYTSSSTAVAEALTAGTSGNTHRYAVDETEFALADGTYAYSIFSGTPSTTASDTWIASGTLYWYDGESRIPLLENAELVFTEDVLEEQATYLNTALEAGSIGTGIAGIWTGSGADPTTIPGPTASRGDKLDWLFAIATNRKRVTDALIQWFAADGSTVIGEATLSPNNDAEVNQSETTAP